MINEWRSKPKIVTKKKSNKVVILATLDSGDKRWIKNRMALDALGVGELFAKRRLRAIT